MREARIFPIRSRAFGALWGRNKCNKPVVTFQVCEKSTNADYIKTFHPRCSTESPAFVYISKAIRPRKAVPPVGIALWGG